MSQHVVTGWTNTSNNVAICCVGMFRSFNRGLKLLAGFKDSTCNVNTEKMGTNVTVKDYNKPFFLL